MQQLSKQLEELKLCSCFVDELELFLEDVALLDFVNALDCNHYINYVKKYFMYEGNGDEDVAFLKALKSSNYSKN